MAFRPLTIDNTAPTNIVFASTSFVASGGTYGTAAARPTLTGTVTEANPGATVTVLNGATPVGSGTVSGANWTATLSTDVPLSTGFDLTIRVTDAAGNSATSAVQRVARDITPPAISSIANDFINEDVDNIDFPGGVPRHAHAGATIALGGPSTACPVTFKHAYLTATSPQGTETTANPLLFKWQVNDQSAVGVPSGTGVNQTAFRWKVTHVPSGTATVQYPVAGTPSAGGYAVDTQLFRDGASPVPAIGLQSQLREGRFDIELEASDLLGNTTTLMRCMDYRPLGVPLERLSVVATSDPLHQPLSSLQLASNSAISPLLNGTHPGAGLMTVRLRNPTAETAYVTFSPATVSPTYSESWSFLRVPSGAPLTVNVDCGFTPCPDRITGAPAVTNDPHTGALVTAATWPAPKVRVFRSTTELAGTTTLIPSTNCTTETCATYSFALPGGPGGPSGLTYDVVVGVTGIPDLRFQSATGYGEAASSYVRSGGTSILTMSNTGLTATVGLLPTGYGGDRTCVLPDQVFDPDTGQTTHYCLSEQRFAARRYLASAGIGLSRVEMSATSTAAPAITTSRQIVQPSAITNQIWTTSETLP